MKSKRFKKKPPEELIRDGLIPMLKERGWYVKIIHGNKFTSGLPDLFCSHRAHGQRWIELKNPLSYHFTTAQKREFPKMHAAGVGIWILVAASQVEINKLGYPPNWHVYYGRTRKPF